MAEPSSGGKPAPTSTATLTPQAPVATSPHPSSFWRWLARAFLSLWWFFVVDLAAGIASYLGNHAGPTLLPLLPKVVDWTRTQSRLVQGGMAVAVLALLALMAWLTYLAWRHRQRQAVEEVEASIAQQVEAPDLIAALERGDVKVLMRAESLAALGRSEEALAAYHQALTIFRAADDRRAACCAPRAGRGFTGHTNHALRRSRQGGRFLRIVWQTFRLTITHGHEGVRDMGKAAIFAMAAFLC